MKTDDKNLEDLITDFLSKVDIGTELLQKKFGVRNILRLWRSKQIERCGEINHETQYELHGVGCAIHFPSESVDFDYGSGGRIDGFDVWRLYIYANDRPEQYKKFTNKKTLEVEFTKYISLNKIEKMSINDNLYVLVRTDQYSPER